jgi:hypothetical protein
LTFAITSLLSSTLLDHAEGFFFVYMSGLLFAGYRVRVPEAPAQRTRESGGRRARASDDAGARECAGGRHPAPGRRPSSRRPCIRSIKAAWPQAAVDALVFAGTREVWRAIPTCDASSRWPSAPMGRARGVHLRLIRRYDLALSCVAGDRPTLYAGSRVAIASGSSARQPHALATLAPVAAVELDDLRTHTVAMNLALADALGIAPRPEVRIRWSAEDAAHVASLLSAADVRCATPRCTCTRNSTTRCARRGMARAGAVAA